jgi:hypothetical protein
VTYSINGILFVRKREMMHWGMLLCRLTLKTLLLLGGYSHSGPCIETVCYMKYPE